MSLKICDDLDNVTVSHVQIPINRARGAACVPWVLRGNLAMRSGVARLSTAKTVVHVPRPGADMFVSKYHQVLTLSAW